MAERSADGVLEGKALGNPDGVVDGVEEGNALGVCTRNRRRIYGWLK